VDLAANPRAPSRARGTGSLSPTARPPRAAPATRREAVRPASALVPGITFCHSGLGRDLVIIRTAMISGTSINGAGFAIAGIMAFALRSSARKFSAATEMQDPRLLTLTEHPTVGSRPKPQHQPATSVISGMARHPRPYPACQRGSRENAEGSSPDPPGGKVQITLRSPFVSVFFADRTPSLNSRVRAARQTRLGSTVACPAWGRGGSGCS